MKKLNVFELKQVSGGDSIAPIPNPPKYPFILGNRVPSVREWFREVGLKYPFILGDRVPEHPITYEDLKN